MKTYKTAGKLPRLINCTDGQLSTQTQSSYFRCLFFFQIFLHQKINLLLLKILLWNYRVVLNIDCLIKEDYRLFVMNSSFQRLIDP
mgnify:CR=1 FL=1